MSLVPSKLQLLVISASVKIANVLSVILYTLQYISSSLVES